MRGWLESLVSPIIPPIFYEESPSERLYWNLIHLIDRRSIAVESGVCQRSWLAGSCKAAAHESKSLEEPCTT